MRDPGHSPATANSAAEAATVRVAITDDHPMVLEGLQALLAADQRLQVVGTAATVASTLTSLDTWQADILVVDYSLPDGSGIDIAHAVRRSDRACEVLLISGVPNPRLIAETIDAGCAGFLTKGAGTEDLCDAIVAISKGSTVFPASAIRRVAERHLTHIGSTLTEREVEVLQLLASPMTATQVAETLFVSPHTVRNHIRSVLSKLHVNSQLEAVIVALQNDIIRLQ